ncbi:Transcriptional regulatory protein CusR [Pontiella desulfatans]|uniref:Transcriptional regulatory protein CusR n=1 Tax=Pontiella desulfatans TaxID=2750659 RepID=A0A6C2U507_PONDE|nr:response regulator transcription factor [Pontiella desulfatans]VGO15148.1 Transcriptional regulatory protein CusR [Pontiella desulfatans]
MRILVVEDEEKIANHVRNGLEELGHVAEVADNGDDGFAMASSGSYDIVLLDILLPGRDGLSVLRALREDGNAIPIILLTALAENQERVEGLELGADDYVTKPFFQNELVARINAVTRRNSVLHAGPLMLNLVTREARYGDEEIFFAPREFSLLEYLMRSPGKVFTRSQLLKYVWGYGFDPQTSLIKVCVRRIREKIDRDGHSFIETVRNAGYRFNAEASRCHAPSS